jgi:LysM repeat protein
VNTTSDSARAKSLIQSAAQALKKGDRRAARHYAEQAAALAPQMEQPWLLLAFLAKPEAAQYYLDRALQVNPTSTRALACQAWLKQQSVPDGTPVEPDLPAAPVPLEPRPPKPAPRHRKRYLVWVVVLVALLAGLVVLVNATRLVETPGKALAKVAQTALSARPTLESFPAVNLTVTTTQAVPPTTTRTASPIPTGTATSTATSTRLPTASPTATQPSPTRQKETPAASTYYTVLPGDTLNLIAQRFSIPLQNLIAANNIINPSVIFVGQVLLIPGGGWVPATSQPAAPTSPAGTPGVGKEIQIDISEQRLYAYQDGKLVFKLIVSTGTGNSTRIGTFKVLDKIPRAYSSRFNIWMPWWMGIYYSGTLENGIHGLPLLMNGVELWGNLLGQPATYGCIESKTSEAKMLYDWAEIGTPVIIRR